MNAHADIFSPALPEPLLDALRDALRRWHDRGLKERMGLVDYLLGEAKEQDTHAGRYAELVEGYEAAAKPVPEQLRQDLEDARAWAATNRALAELLTAFEIAFATPKKAAAPPTVESLKDELSRLEGEVKVRKARIREIYKASLSAPEADKVGPDFMAEMLSEEPCPKLQYPVVVHGLTWGDVPTWKPSRRGTPWVAVRPCEGDGKKTYLGILVGEVALSVSARYDPESGVFCITPAMHNPAIWVPDIGKLVFGAESWWGAIKSPDDMRKITDADIHGVWYVRALRDLSGEPAKEAPIEFGPGDLVAYQCDGETRVGYVCKICEEDILVEAVWVRPPGRFPGPHGSMCTGVAPGELELLRKASPKEARRWGN